MQRSACRPWADRPNAGDVACPPRMGRSRTTRVPARNIGVSPIPFSWADTPFFGGPNRDTTLLHVQASRGRTRPAAFPFSTTAARDAMALGGAAGRGGVWPARFDTFLRLGPLHCMEDGPTGRLPAAGRRPNPEPLSPACTPPCSRQRHLPSPRSMRLRAAMAYLLRGPRNANVRAMSYEGARKGRPSLHAEHAEGAPSSGRDVTRAPPLPLAEASRRLLGGPGLRPCCEGPVADSLKDSRIYLRSSMELR